MGGYILEVLAGRSWCREGTTFWTKGDAKREAERILRRGKAKEVRILPVSIGEDAIECLPVQVPEVNDANECHL